MSIALGIVGGGVMGEAILSRLLAQGRYAPEAILASDPSPQRREYLQQQYGIRVAADNREAATASDILLLATKPQVLDRVAPELAQPAPDSPKPLVVSILAGVRLARLEAALPGYPIVRAMPNTPATVGAGMTAIALSEQASTEQCQRARAILEAVGQVIELPEPLLDGATGVAGSGPAYVAMAIEALADGGVAAGLSRASAYQLALQTVLGTAQLLQASGQHPAELKDRVTSPGGTTIAAVGVLERAGFRAALADAVRAAQQRAGELGQ